MWINILCMMIIFVVGCSKDNNKKLGAEQYKMSVLELKGERTSEINLRSALKYIDDALVQEDSPRYKAHKATLLFLLGDKKASEKLFGIAMRDVHSGEVRLDMLNNYACLLAENGYRDRALKLFEELERDKSYMTPQVALVNQAKIYSERRKFSRAKMKLMRAIDMSTDYVDAYFYLAKVCLRLNDEAGAKKALEGLLRVDSGHKWAREMLRGIGGVKK